MRKIDKTCNLSTVYKAWEESLEAQNIAHPKYGSTKTKNEYYSDIIMQLYYCQQGLCAYTERLLCSPEYFQSHHWKAGKYNSSKPPANVEGQLDHFDPTLKSKKKDATGKKDWLWDNFFLCHSDINTKVKGIKPVDYILKPDEKTYDPFQLLEYDFETHLFIPHSKLEKATADRVEKTLQTLGVNYFNDRRRSYLEDKLKFIQLGTKTWETTEIIEFPTAFTMCKTKVDAGELTFDSLFANDLIEKDAIESMDDLLAIP